ncbi:MAG TPA: aminoacyl-tRNA hydrolase [Candidatus Paceibacterota bacterium]|nr:aminoacyl-tRNA hydrolase [Candidatus Paceibacterota bacterium]
MKANFNINNIKLLIGLGNPDKKYKNTYHNIGHRFINYVEKNTNLSNIKTLASTTFMNKSGHFVKEKLQYFNLTPQQILVIHDDSDIELGRYKISFNRGSAGHKGINSIINHLNTKKFWRLRIGIRPKDFKGKAEKFVLKKISKENQKEFETTFKKILEDLELTT